MGKYAAGLDLEQMTDFARGLSKKILFRGRLWDFQVPPKSGLIWGRKTTRYIDQLLGSCTFADLTIPTYVVAADILTGQQVVFEKGPVAPAVRASISMTGIFAPTQIDDYFLVDGGVVNPLPASVLAQRGANVIIGCSVIAGFKDEIRFKGTTRGKDLNILDVISRQMAIMEREIVKTRMGPVNVLIRPRIETFTTMDYDQATELIHVGRKAAQEALPKIQALLAPQSPSR